MAILVGILLGIVSGAFIAALAWNYVSKPLRWPDDGSVCLDDIPPHKLTDSQREYLRRTAPGSKLCMICGGPATKFKALPPWPGTSYAHTSYACDEHESYLHGHSWSRTGDDPPVDQGVPKSSCCDCHGPYGSCGCPRQAVAMQSLRWEQDAVIGEVRR